MAFELRSTGLRPGETIPQQYTGDGQDVSPPLEWTDPPSGAKSLALVCEDPDAPRGTFTHWIVFNVPATSRELAEGVSPEATLPDGAAQGVNDFGKIGYGGPAPPAGKPHRYFFKLYALDRSLDLRPGAKKEQFQTAIKGHVLAEAQLMGAYAR